MTLDTYRPIQDFPITPYLTPRLQIRTAPRLMNCTRQDHGCIKQGVRPMQTVQVFRNRQVTIGRLVPAYQFWKEKRKLPRKIRTEVCQEILGWRYSLRKGTLSLPEAIPSLISYLFQFHSLSGSESPSRPKHLTAGFFFMMTYPPQVVSHRDNSQSTKYAAFSQLV